MMKYGVVQGRLLPQVGNFIQNFPHNWRSEFEIAKRIGASHIELIDGAPNQELQLADINELPADVPVSAVCLDWLVHTDHLGNQNRMWDVLQLADVCENALRLKIPKVVLPLLEKASLKSAKELDDKFFYSVVGDIQDLAIEFKSLKFSIETDLDVEGMLELLRKSLTNQPNVGITFDTGNLTKLGYDLNKHIDAYQTLIDNVHIKDCIINKSTVQLGTGDTDFTVLKRLFKSPYIDHMTFQTARSPGTEIDTFLYNVRTIEDICF